MVEDEFGEEDENRGLGLEGERERERERKREIVRGMSEKKLGDLKLPLCDVSIERPFFLVFFAHKMVTVPTTSGVLEKRSKNLTEHTLDGIERVCFFLPNIFVANPIGQACLIGSGGHSYRCISSVFVIISTGQKPNLLC